MFQNLKLPKKRMKFATQVVKNNYSFAPNHVFDKYVSFNTSDQGIDFS